MTRKSHLRLTGAQIVHIIPLDRKGDHTRGLGWGMVEDDELVKNFKAAICQASFKAYKKRKKKQQQQQ